MISVLTVICVLATIHSSMATVKRERSRELCDHEVCETNTSLCWSPWSSEESGEREFSCVRLTSLGGGCWSGVRVKFVDMTIWAGRVYVIEDVVSAYRLTEELGMGRWVVMRTGRKLGVGGGEQRRKLFFRDAARFANELVFLPERCAVHRFSALPVPASTTVRTPATTSAATTATTTTTTTTTTTATTPTTTMSTATPIRPSIPPTPDTPLPPTLQSSPVPAIVGAVAGLGVLVGVVVLVWKSERVRVWRRVGVSESLELSLRIRSPTGWDNGDSVTNSSTSLNSPVSEEVVLLHPPHTARYSTSPPRPASPLTPPDSLSDEAIVDPVHPPEEFVPPIPPPPRKIPPRRRKSMRLQEKAFDRTIADVFAELPFHDS